MIVLYIVVALLILLVMITIHELGHYTAGKIFKFTINEFAIGFGPAIIKKKNKKTGEIFSLRAFPLGGYCAFGEDDVASEKDKKQDEQTKELIKDVRLDQNRFKSGDLKPADPNHFQNQKPWKRLVVLSAGAIFNFIFGVVFTAIMLGTIGYDIPKVTEITQQISSNETIYASNPNYINGESILKEGDAILKINNKKISVMGGNTMTNLVDECEVGKNTLTIRRDGKKQEIEIWVYETPTLTLKTNDQDEPIDANGNVIKEDDPEAKNKVIFLPVTDEETGQVVMRKVLGIADYEMYRHTFFEAIGRAPEVSVGLGLEVLKAFGGLFTGATKVEDLSGPVGTISTIAVYTQQAPTVILAFVPIISINLAIFNLLPIPALDGGRMIFVIIEWIRRKPIKREVEGMIHFIGMCLLLGAVLILDIVKALM